MKILIVNTSDIQGGAARAAYRLHKALLNEHIDSQMLVQDKISDDWTVLGSSTKIAKGFAKVKPTLDAIPTKCYPHRTKTLFSPSWLPCSQIVKKINKINPDIVHLHWICGGMFKIEDLAKIKQPIVWSLHDNWAFTGGCHIKWECDKYKNNCGACPRLSSTKENDLSRRIWKRKRKVFNTLNNLTIIGLSNWVTQCSKESHLLKDKTHINLPNPINTRLFQQFDKIKARELWNLPQDKKLVTFGAMGATSDVNKGFKELSQALQQLQNKNIELIVFGSSEPKEKPNFNFKSHYLGHLYDDVSLVTLYSACDVMVVPSIQENLSNAIMESLSCGTPVVAFNVGGNNDMIEHHKNGYLAKPFDSNDLATGIDWILENEQRYQQLCFAAREKAITKFDSEKVAKQYIELYQSLLLLYNK